MNSEELTYIPATPGHWCVYRHGDAVFKRPVIAWCISERGILDLDASAVHPGSTPYDNAPYARIDPSATVTLCSDNRRTWPSWLLFLAWVQAGGVVE